MNELNLAKGLFESLPTICGALLRCDELMREHEEKQAMKYSDQEYLKAVHRLYKSGRISGEQAQKAMGLIFQGGNKTIETKPHLDPIEQQLMQMIEIN